MFDCQSAAVERQRTHEKRRCKNVDTDRKHMHRLVEPAKVAVVLCRLDVVLAKCLHGEVERGEVQVLRLLEQSLFSLLVVTVDGNLLEYQRCVTFETLANNGYATLNLNYLVVFKNNNIKQKIDL